jgi:ribose transport system substrate-binding protein
MGAIEALKGANRTAQVIGINGAKEAVDATRVGKLLAIGDYNGFPAGLHRHHDRDPLAARRAGCAGDRAEADCGDQGELNYQPYETPTESRARPNREEAAKLAGK